MGVEHSQAPSALSLAGQRPGGRRETVCPGRVEDGEIEGGEAVLRAVTPPCEARLLNQHNGPESAHFIQIAPTDR